jgi:hypothetical protein
MDWVNDHDSELGIFAEEDKDKDGRFRNQIVGFASLSIDTMAITSNREISAWDWRVNEELVTSLELIFHPYPSCLDLW